MYWFPPYWQISGIDTEAGKWQYGGKLVVYQHFTKAQWTQSRIVIHPQSSPTSVKHLEPPSLSLAQRCLTVLQDTRPPPRDGDGEDDGENIEFTGHLQLLHSGILWCTLNRTVATSVAIIVFFPTRDHREVWRCRRWILGETAKRQEFKEVQNMHPPIKGRPSSMDFDRDDRCVALFHCQHLPVAFWEPITFGPGAKVILSLLLKTSVINGVGELFLLLFF